MLADNQKESVLGPGAVVRHNSKQQQKQTHQYIHPCIKKNSDAPQIWIKIAALDETPLFSQHLSDASHLLRVCD